MDKYDFFKKKKIVLVIHPGALATVLIDFFAFGPPKFIGFIAKLQLNRTKKLVSFIKINQGEIP